MELTQCGICGDDLVNGGCPPCGSAEPVVAGVLAAAEVKRLEGVGSSTDTPPTDVPAVGDGRGAEAVSSRNAGEAQLAGDRPGPDLFQLRDVGDEVVLQVEEWLYLTDRADRSNAGILATPEERFLESDHLRRGGCYDIDRRFRVVVVWREAFSAATTGKEYRDIGPSFDSMTAAMVCAQQAVAALRSQAFAARKKDIRILYLGYVPSRLAHVVVN
jgi:hypothetical protein